MDVEERTEKAIILTRELILRSLDDTQTIMMMIINDVNPEDIENMVTDILEYLDKTKPEVEG